MITHRNSLDICPGGVPLFIRLSQYDSSFTLIFDLFSHKGSFTVESGTTARFRELKPDGNAISIDATISGTTVTLAPSQANAQQMTAIAGNCKCELSLFKGDKELNTANFTLLIEKAVIDKDTPYSDSVIRELIDVTDRADEIMEAAETVDAAVEELGTLIDPTLTQSGKAADAKAVGDALSNSNGAVRLDKVQDNSFFEKLLAKSNIGINVVDTERFLNALKICMDAVPWLNDDGGNRISMLLNSLYDLRLPDNYVRLNYIESWGNLAIDTGIKPQLPMRFHAVFSENLGVNASGTPESFGSVIAAGGTANSRFYPIGETVESWMPVRDRPNESYIVFRFGNNVWNMLKKLGAWDLLIDEELQVSRSGNDFTLTYNINGDQGSQVFTIQNFTLTTNNLFVYHSPNAFNPMTKGNNFARVYGLEIGNNSTTLFKGVPCCYLPDGVCGLYDLVHEEFHPLVDYS